VCCKYGSEVFFSVRALIVNVAIDMQFAILNHDGFVTQLDGHCSGQFHLFSLRLVTTKFSQVVVSETCAAELRQDLREVLHLRRCQTNATMRREGSKLCRRFAAVN